MGHISLYRKYRPQTFAEIIGQSHVTTTLERAVAEGRLAHAYLFSGPRGTGKTSTARILAKALNCEKGPTPDFDNSCDSCKEIAGGTSLDVVEIDAASHGSVDDARELREKVAYAPVGGKWKVYIIDECHMLSAAANNALLKVLEEPPAHVIFVFATTEPHKVLQTLLDRCQRYEFRALNSEDIKEHLAAVSEGEKVEIDEEALAVMASRAGGSMRDALSFLDQLVSFAGHQVSVEDVMRLLGSLPGDLLFEAVDLISERDAGAVLQFCDRLIREGRDVREFARALVDHLRSLFLIVHAPAAQDILGVPDESFERFRSQANHFGEAELLRIMDLANEVSLQLRQAVEPRLALELGMARMTRPDLHATPGSLLSRLERLERRAGIEGEAGSPSREAAATRTRPKAPRGKPRRSEKRGTEAGSASSSVPVQAPKAEEAPEVQEAPAKPAATGEVSLDLIQKSWEVVLEKVKKKKVSLRAFLLEATPVGFEDGVLTLEFGPTGRFHHDQIKDPNKQEPLVEAVFETVGMRPSIRCVLNEQAPPRPQPGSGSKPSEKKEHRESSDPVDVIRSTFEGSEVVEES